MDNHEVHNKQAEENIVKNVAEHDCHISLIDADDYLPGFAYSIGLKEKFNHPEIIIFGLNNQVMGHLINHVRNELRGWETLYWFS